MLLKHFIHLLSFFVLLLPERKLHFGFIVSCGVVYQLYVFKFMNATFPGACGVYAFHSPVIILCTTIVRIQNAF